MVKTESFLVAGGTGTQGGATARELLSAGNRVRVLTRDPGSVAAVELAKRGVELVRGDMGEPKTLEAAMQAVYGVFSVQRPDTDGTDSERRHGFALVDAARRAGVRHFVHASVCQAGQHMRFPRWDTGYWPQKYWTDKWEVEQAIQEAGFPSWTVLRPSFIMDNFTQPKASVLFPQLRRGLILTPVRPDSRLQLISGDDIGAFARAAFADPARFNHKALELAADALTMDEIAATLSGRLGKTVTLKSISPDDARDAGLPAGWIRAQEWINEVGYHVDVDQLAAYDVPLTPFAAWVQRHAADFVIGT